MNLKEKFFKKDNSQVVVVQFTCKAYGLYFPQNEGRILCSCGGHVSLLDYDEDLRVKMVLNPYFDIDKIWWVNGIISFDKDFDPVNDLMQVSRIWRRGDD